MDEDQLGALITTIYTSAFEEDGWDRVLASLLAPFHASQVIAQVWGWAQRAPVFTSSTVEDASANGKYDAYYHSLDPTYPAYLNNPPKHLVFPLAELFKPDWLFTSAFYCDFIKNYDMGQGGHALLDSNAHQLSHLHVHRPRHAREFSAGELKLLATLRPHLNRSLHIYREMTGLRAKASLFDTALEMVAATFMLDPTGWVLALNKNAEALLSGNSPLTVQAGRLTARHPPDNARLAAALAPSAPGAPPPELVLRGSAYCPGMRLTITPVNGRMAPLMSDVNRIEEVAFLVAARTIGPTMQNLIASYGLTRAEAEVALLLAQGLRATHIAAHRETSTATVNTQLKQIYAKTGVDGHAGLLVKLLGR